MSSSSHASNGTVPGRNGILQNVTRIVAEQMDAQVDEMSEDNALIEDLGCDSLDVVEITMELEEHFDISIPDSFAEKARTIGDVTDGVLQLLGGSNAG